MNNKMANSGMPDPIVVTGTGTVLPTGRGLDPLWSAWTTGTPAFSSYRDRVIDTQHIRWFGHVPEEVDAAARQRVPHKLRRFAPELACWGVLAVHDALEQAGANWAEIPQERRGVYAGQSDTPYPQVASVSQAMVAAHGDQGFDFAKFTDEALFRRGADPFTVINGLTNNVLALVSMTYGFRGDCGAFAHDESAALSALKRACFSLTHGYCDIAVVVGAGSYNEALTLTEHYGLNHLSPAADGRHSVRSFDHRRDGTLLGEGATALVLERRSDALRRGAEPLVEIAGTLGTSIDPNPARRPRLITDRLRSLMSTAGTRAEEIAWVSADGKGLAESDADEMAVLDTLLAGAPVPVTTVRPIVGAVSAAGPLADVAVAARIFRERSVPPVATLMDPASDRINFVRETPRPCAGGEFAMTLHTSFNGFFGATLLKTPASRRSIAGGI
jgi:3-oxoacyl-(acyl-carrier-protein) synthase